MRNETLLGPSDDNWWRKVFTQSEHDALLKRFTEIVDEDNGVEPIAVVILLAPKEFEETFLNVYHADQEGFKLDTVGMTFAQEYIAQAEIEASERLNEAADYFGFGQDTDDDEGDEDRSES